MLKVSRCRFGALSLLLWAIWSCEGGPAAPESAALQHASPAAAVQALSNVDSDGDGYSPKEGDCNDSNPYVWPGAPEICDEIDNDCDAEIDNAPWTDADGDGFYSISSCLEWSQDCDDNNENVWLNCESCVDNDNDGAYTGCDSYDSVAEDCNDSDPRTYPNAAEICDGLDNDCDLDVDEGLTTPEIVLLSNDTLDCELDGSPFTSADAWSEPRVRIATNAHDVTIRNCVLSNRAGAIVFEGGEDILIENTIFTPRATACDVASLGVISGDFEGSLTLRNVRVTADDGTNARLWRYTAVDVSAISATTLLIEDSSFATAAGLRAYTGSDITIRRSQFRGSATAAVELKEGNSDATPLAGVFALANSILVQDSVFETFNEGCVLVAVGTGEITGNRFNGCDVALDSTGSSAGYAYLNDFGPRFALGPIQLYDSRALSTQNMGNYWGGTCVSSTFDTGDFFDTYSPPDAHPFGVRVAGVANGLRAGSLSHAPPCPLMDPLIFVPG